ITIFAPAALAGQNDISFVNNASDLDCIRGMAVDGSTIYIDYIADSVTPRLRKIASSVYTDYMFPTGQMAIDGTGKLYVSGGDGRQIYAGTPSSITIFNTPGYDPKGITVNSVGSMVYFTSTGDNLVCQMDADGNVSVIPSTAGQLNNPEGLALDNLGNLYIADSDNSRICKVDASGAFSAVLTAANGLSSPECLAVDRFNNLFISDSGRVYKYQNGNLTVVAGNPAGTHVAGAATDFFFNSIEAIDIGGDDNLYIADSGFKDVLKVQLVPNTPTINPNGGNYNSAQTVAVGIDATLSAGQSVYYTTDGTSPSVSSSVYTTPFEISLTAGATRSVKAGVYETISGLWSSVASALFTVPGDDGGSAAGGSKPAVPPTIVSIPIVRTDSATSITLNEATLNGTITNSGNAVCTLVDFQYRLKDSSVWYNTPTQSVALGDGGTFSANLSGIRSNATYEYRARANNVMGWGEGSINSFTTTNIFRPTVVTKSATNVGPDKVTLNAAITDNGGAEVTDSGFWWGVAAEGRNGLQQVHVTPGADGSLNLDLTGLKKNTTYTFQAYADNAGGMSYGNMLQFTTPKIAPPTVETLAPSDVESSSVVFHGRVTKVTGKITDIGFKFSLGQGDGWAAADKGPDANGYFSATITRLQPGTTYSYEAFATSDAGTGSGDRVSFTTLTNAPEVETRAPSAVTSTNAIMNGFIIKNRGYAVTEQGFLWGTEPNPCNKESTLIGSDGRQFSFSLTGLRGSTKYYVQAYAINAQGVSFGETLSFTTGPAAKPTVTTTAVYFSPGSWESVLKGSIVSNGGADLSEYGFRYSTDKQTWTNLVNGLNNKYDEFVTNLSASDQLPAGKTYYVQAYAINPAGTAYGSVLSLSIPGPPTVTASIDKSTIDGSSGLLTGSITSTGAQGASCVAHRFQYREAGGSDWLNVDEAQGSFAPGLFTYKLTGLKNGTKYEFRAQAANPGGWGSSQPVSFTTEWGQTDKETALNMKNAGFNSVDIANVLKSRFNDTNSEAAKILQFVGFGAKDIANGLKNSAYKDSLANVAGILKTRGFDVVAVALALTQIYPTELAILSSGQRDTGCAKCLQRAGYGIDDIMTAMKAAYGWDIFECVDRLPNNLGVSRDDIFKAIARLYGAKVLANTFWTHGRKNAYIPVNQTLGELATVLKNDAGLDPLQCATLMKELYPPLDPNLLAYLFYYQKYSVVQTGSAIVQMFGSDPAVVANAMINTNYDKQQIIAFLAKDMQCNVIQLVKIISSTKWFNPSEDV
ncbi:MAG: chitobiase/beta-hexosaminidase C-terminal domain-containing protein, partial [Candidatus Saccharibacteria bacterium]